MTLVWTWDPESKGLIPAATPSWFTCVRYSTPVDAMNSSRNRYILELPGRVDVLEGNGGFPGAKALSASRAITEESFPML